MSENAEFAAREALAFEEFPKIPRLKREVVVTEKIDGSNAQIRLVELNSPELLNAATVDPFCLRIYPGVENGASAFALYAGSRTRWLDTSSKGDNFSFAKWVLENSDELYKLGPGRHYGEWYGLGIQRNYGLKEKRFALFNVARWTAETKPTCCDVVPILARGERVDPDYALDQLTKNGSVMAPGFMNPEGVVVFHSASRQLYKLTIKEDGGKWQKTDHLQRGDVLAMITPNLNWTRRQAIELCELLEAMAPDYGAHVALTGGCLYKDGDRPDVDIMFYRIRQKKVNEAGLLAELVDHGFSLRGRYGWVQKAVYKGKNVDLFFPNTEVSEYVPGQRAGTSSGDIGY